MSRDMKPRRSQPAKKKSGGGTLVGMFIGLVLGVVAAAGLAQFGRFARVFCAGAGWGDLARQA